MPCFWPTFASLFFGTGAGALCRRRRIGIRARSNCRLDWSWLRRLALVVCRRRRQSIGWRNFRRRWRHERLSSCCPLGRDFLRWLRLFANRHSEAWSQKVWRCFPAPEKRWRARAATFFLSLAFVDCDRCRSYDWRRRVSALHYIRGRYRSRRWRGQGRWILRLQLGRRDHLRILGFHFRLQLGLWLLDPKRPSSRFAVPAWRSSVSPLWCDRLRRFLELLRRRDHQRVAVHLGHGSDRAAAFRSTFCFPLDSEPLNRPVE